MKITVPLIYGFVFASFITLAQNTSLPANFRALDSLQAAYHQKWMADSTRAVDLGLPLVQQSERNTLSFIGFEGNSPLYVSSNTLGEVGSFFGNQLWASPYNVTGTGLSAGIWEAFFGTAALPDATNGNLLTNGISPSRVILSNSGSTSSHATNVALRLAGDGAADATNGVGVAKTAQIVAWDINNLYAEMSGNIGSYIVSNHSYALVRGWTPPISWTLGSETKNINWWSESNVNKTEDYGFGRYGTDDYNLDLLAKNAPYHSIVKAAGNDRGQTGTTPVTTFYTLDGVNYTFDTYSTPVPEIDGGIDGYDCLPSGAVAKNAFIVGACQDISGGYTTSADVVVMSFSAFGPTDDGRMKPDFVAPGSGGTSYAAPNVSSSILLLQEIHQKNRGGYLKSASVKALLAHTAFEAGTSVGPDYKHGWGLINPKGAADLILDQTGNSYIIEETLSNSQSAYFLVYSDGVSNLTATLSWTDPAGTPTTRSYGISDLNKGTAMLVNDLDFRLVALDNTVLAQPYVLDPSNPVNAATNGDNFRDNIEKFSHTPSAGWYAVRVSHKGTLAAPQDFSLVISGARSGGCLSNSLPIIDNVWNGTTWSTTFTNGQNVVVSGTLNISTNTTFGSVLLHPNTVLNISSGNTLSVTGNVWSFADVTFTGAGFVTLAGTTNQLWCGGAAAKNLEINNVSGANLEGGAIAIDDVVLLTSGVLQTSGNLILRSTAGSYAQISEAGGSISGEIEFQQTITSQGWHHIASPVATNLGDLVADMADYVLANTGGSIYYWDAANGQWAEPVDTSSAFLGTTPLNAFFGTSGSRTFSTVPFTIRLKGLANSSLQNNSLVYGPATAISNNEAGWNHIANPYPQNLDWNSIKANFGGANINGNYYVWDAGSNLYRNHDGSTGDVNLGGSIAPGQAFFVRMLDAPAALTTAFDFTNANRTLAKASFFKSNYPQLTLSVTQDSIRDDFYLVFAPGNEVGLQPEIDAFKLFSPALAVPQIYQQSDSTTGMATNYVDDNFNRMSIPVAYKNTSEGSANLAIELANIDADWVIVLEDMKLNRFHNPRNGAYQFAHQPGNIANRFVLHINKNSDGDLEENSEMIVWGSDGNFNLSLAQPLQSGTLFIYNSVGKLVHKSAYHQIWQVSFPFASKGVFFVVVEGKDGSRYVTKWVN